MPLPLSLFALLFFLTISLPCIAEEGVREVEGPSTLVELKNRVKDWSKRSNKKLEGALKVKVENVETYSSIVIRVDCIRHLRRLSTADGRPKVRPYWKPRESGFTIFVHWHDGVIIGRRKNDDELLQASKIKWAGVNQFSGTLTRDTPRGFSAGISGKLGSNLDVSRRLLISQMISDLVQTLSVNDRFEDGFFEKLQAPSKSGEQDITPDR